MVRKKLVPVALSVVALGGMSAAAAAPITLSLEGSSFGVQSIGADVPSPFVTQTLSSSVFGALPSTWTATLTYDSDTTSFLDDILGLDGSGTSVPVGSRYGGGSSAEVQFGGGGSLSSINSAVEVFDGTLGFFPHYLVEAFFDPNVIFSSPPPAYASFASSITLSLIGESPDTDPLASPPLGFDGLTSVQLFARICGDFDQDARVIVENECIEFTGSGSVAPTANGPDPTTVPEPATPLLLASAIAAFAGARRARKGKT